MLSKIPPDPLLLENVTVFADLETALVYYQYRNIVSSVETREVYQWVKHALQTWFKEDDFRGAIFDFRDVTKFSFGNTAVAKEQSREVNEISDLSIFPISLVVTNTKQDVQVRMAMPGGDSSRKHVAYSTQDALDFINEWNLQHDRNFDLSEELMNKWPSMKVNE